MILINNVNLPLDACFSDLKPYVAKALKIKPSLIKNAKVYRKSVDARKKNDVHFCCSLTAELLCDEKNIIMRNKNASEFSQNKYSFEKAKNKPENRPVIVGFGPAGMFCALILARAGLKPLVLEMGNDVDTRTADVKAFFEGGKINPLSNVQFGEGGAGTFSDGKLNTGIKDLRCRFVLETFYHFGANENILTDAKPHVGTDVLVKVVKNIRKEIISLGGDVRFGAKVDDIILKDGKISAVSVSGTVIECEILVFATGHSARETFKLLKTKNFAMERKPFSVGVRIEHLQKDINRALYGDFANSEYLRAADYKLAVHLENGRGVYTFCMCPGGEVINSSSEEGGVAVNGMSYSARDGENANSALLVGVNPEDLPGSDPLEGCAFQRKIENAAYNIKNGAVPVETVGSFVFGKENRLGKVKPTVKSEFVFASLKDIFPDFVTESLKAGIVEFDKKIKGFSDYDAVLSAPETRSSSPVRILRDNDGQSLSVKGVYPCGEGAGYAGGITSAAVDGIKTAEKIIGFLNNN